MSKVASANKEAACMSRNPNLLLLYQTLVAFLAMAFLAMSIATAWTLFYLQEPRDRRGPGINLKEL